MKIVIVFEVDKYEELLKINSLLADKVGIENVKTEHHFLLNKRRSYAQNLIDENNCAIDKLIALANEERINE